MNPLHNHSIFPILSYDFQNVSSTIVPDISLNGSIGVIKGHDRGGASLKSESVFGTALSTLFLSGGGNGGYLQFPDSILNNTEGFSISFYSKVHSLEESGTIFSFGQDSCFYLSVIPDPNHDKGFLISPCATKGGRSQEASLENWISLSFNTWFHIVVTFDAATPSQCRFYLDGKEMGTFIHRRMNSLNLSNEAHCYLGTSSFSHSLFPLSVASILLYPKVLAAQQISTLFAIEDTTRFLLETKQLMNLFQQPLTKALQLPSIGNFGVTFSWNSLSPKLLSHKGLLIRPDSSSSPQEASIECTMSYKSLVFKQLFSMTILPLPTDYDLLAEDLDNVTISYPKHVVANISLPKTGINGSSFHWESSKPQLVTSTGILSRPKSSLEQVTLTLTGILNAEKNTKEFTLTLFPIYGQKKMVSHPHFLPYRQRSSTPISKKVTSPFGQVTLAKEGLLAENWKRCLNYLLLLDSDRMLYNFRKAFGQDPLCAAPLGGWEEPTGLLRGHSTGHLLSALAFAFSSTKDVRFLEKSNYIIGELRSMQLCSKGKPQEFVTTCTPTCASQSLWNTDPSTWGIGFLSAYSPDQFALLEQLTPYATIWAPYSTLHKLLAGLLDCYTLTNNSTALACAEGIGSWVYHRLNGLSAQLRAEMWSLYIAGEYGGMNESLALLSQLTHKKEYMDAAKMFDNPKIFDGLIKDSDTISGIHANQHIPQIIGAMEEYQSSDNLDYYELARNFWRLVTAHYSYSIGGVGRGENFKEADILANHIESDRNCETCAAYNMLKLTSRLYAYEPLESSYMDYYERTVLNQIAASQNPEIKSNAHHGVTYMLPIGSGAQRGYSNDYDDFTCCHGTGMESHVKYSQQIYHIEEKSNTLFVNLFFSSTLSLSEDLCLTQAAGPGLPQSQLTIKGNGFLNIKIRIPYWCKSDFKVEYNSTLQPAPSPKDSYYTLSKHFSDADKIMIHLPHKLHLCFTPDNINNSPVASIMYGPLVMTALSDSEEFLTLNLPPNLEEAFTLRTSPSPMLWYDDLQFVPMYEAHNVKYHTYFKINLL